jgi:nitroreductase
METLEAINMRASLKTRLSSKEIEPEKIEKLLEAAKVAPSARNNQPWRFIVIKEREIIKSLADNAFYDVNNMVHEAPIIIVVCANPDDDIKVSGKEYYLFDAGLAVENMILAATDQGLATHPMSGLDEPAMKKVLQVPDNIRIVVAMPVAYPSGNSYQEAASERLSQRTRKDFKEIVFRNKWGNIA